MECIDEDKLEIFKKKMNHEVIEFIKENFDMRITPEKDRFNVTTYTNAIKDEIEFSFCIHGIIKIKETENDIIIKKGAEK